MEEQAAYQNKNVELEREILLDIFAHKEIETRFLAQELKLSAGDFRKWLCAMGVLCWVYSQGYTINEQFKSWGYCESKFNLKTQKYNYFIFWNLKGRIEIHKMYRRWIADGNRPMDIKQFKR